MKPIHVPLAVPVTLLMALIVVGGPRTAVADCVPDTETCDGIDNDCDGEVDEGFGVGGTCAALFNPAGCLPGDPAGCCVTGGIKKCLGDGSGVFCDPQLPQRLRAPEGPAPSASCSDTVDNDCDSLTDAQEPGCQQPETCNGLDDDGDGIVDDGFVGKGDPCTVGFGQCQQSGTIVCNAAQDGVECSAVPLPPKSEGPAGSPSCADGKDNDCDGATDVADPSCQAAEKCDGLDNDGDGDVDEDFPDLGSACTAGAGACAAVGVKVCSADGMSTVCNAMPAGATPEGPSGATCSDGIDNDCDGTTDAADPGCGSAGLQVTCALPYVTGKPGADCTGRHRIQFSVTGSTGPELVVTSELLAIDLAGNIVSALPVKNGDLAHLLSRTKGPILATKTGNSLHVSAPVPMLRVTAVDGLGKAEAYCSPIPYLDVVEPAGKVVSESVGDTTHVVAAIPLVDPASIFVKVDGADLLAEMGLNPATAFPGGPYSGDVTINGRTVHVADLVVRTAAVATASSNTLVMNLTGLGCGGHVVVVDGEQRPGSFPKPNAAVCDVDDLRDKGTSSGFAIDVFSPAPGEISGTPTPVTGEVCHGRAIANLKINGKPLDVSGQTLTPGDGEDSGDVVKLPFDTTLPLTDLALDFATGNAPVGTFDPGSNRLIADATDVLANRTFKNFIFAVGSVAKPQAGPLTLASLPPEYRQLARNVREVLDTAMLNASTTISNAFHVGLTPSAVQKKIDDVCNGDHDNDGTSDFGKAFLDQTKAFLTSAPALTATLEVNCSCNPDVTVQITDVTGDPNQVSCPLVFEDGRIRATINLPNVTLFATAKGSCCDCDVICLSETIVDLAFHKDITQIKVEFDITEARLEGTEPPPALVPSSNNGADPVFTKDTVETNCIGNFFCNIGAFFVEVFTLTFADALDAPDIVNVTTPLADTQLDQVDQDPTDAIKVGPNEEKIEQFGAEVHRQPPENVEITAGGLTMSFAAEFATTDPDPNVPDSPGAELTPAAAPITPIPNGGEAYFVLADDVMNQLFASLVASGKLKTSHVSLTALGILLDLPADCEMLTGDTPEKQAFLQGVCHGMQGATCGSIPITSGGGLGLTEIGACILIKAKNLSATTPTLIRAVQDLPPNFKIQDNAATDGVETILRLGDLNAEIVADHNANGTADGELGSLPNCFAEGAPTTTDCVLLGACLDLNLLARAEIAPPGVCPPDPDTGLLEPGLVFQPVSVQTVLRDAGQICRDLGVETPNGDNPINDTAAGSNAVQKLEDEIEASTPPLCAGGLSLEGAVTFVNPRLVAVETDGSPEFQDYFGITGDIQP